MGIVRLTPLLAVALVATMTVAGCASGESAPPRDIQEDSSRADAGDGAETLEGVILSEDLAPIPGALVNLDEREQVQTGDDGRFRFVGVAAGGHKLIVQALGYESVLRAVTLPLGEGTILQITLGPVQVEDPYVELILLRGYSICDISLIVWITYVSPCPLGDPARTVIASIGESWRYGVVEMEWTALESFILYTALDGNCNTSNQCFGATAGRSPLRLEMAPDDEEIAKKYAPFTGVVRPYPEGKFRLFSNVLYAGALQKEANDVAHDQCVAAIGFRFGCPGVGVSAVGLPFSKYISIFHWERPSDPAAYTGLPDG